VSLRAVAGFAETEDHAKNITAFDESLNKIFGQLAPGEPLVIDIRFNGGGYDDYSLMITGRLTDTPKVAFLKQPRIQGTHQYGTLHVRHVFPASGPHATGPVILLTSGLTYSGAEIFTMATMQFANVIRVGEPTAGCLSDVLEFKLPNGWAMGVSNERYFTFDGICYEDTGVPPHVEAAMTPEALEKRIDPGIETAMKLIAERRKASAKTGAQD
jgi:C-terminal processing protease CtpA/Prc